MQTDKVGTEKEKHLILLTLNNYLEGRPSKDISRLQAAFHPDANIRTIAEGKLAQWTLLQYLELVEKAEIQRCSPQILSFSWDGDTGSAQVQLRFDSFQFIDRFNLVKLDGAWLIMDKISYCQKLP